MITYYLEYKTSKPRKVFLAENDKEALEITRNEIDVQCIYKEDEISKNGEPFHIIFGE